MRKPKAVTDTIAVIKAAPVVLFGTDGRYMASEVSKGAPVTNVDCVVIERVEALRLVERLTKTDARTRNDGSKGNRKKKTPTKAAKRSR